jgi:hypothetical protein
MPWKIKSHDCAGSASFDGHPLPHLLDDGPVPVILVHDEPANHRIEDENGQRAVSFVALSLYGVAQGQIHSIQLVSFNGGKYAFDFIDNNPSNYRTLDAVTQGLKEQTHHAKTAAVHLSALWNEMGGLIQRIGDEVTDKVDREGYERACFLYGVAAKTDEQILGEDDPTYGVLNALLYPGWTRHEIYESAIDSARRAVLRLERGLHVDHAKCRCDYCKGAI